MEAISVERALSDILDHVLPLGTEKLDLLHSLGRVLAEPILAARDHPPWDSSAMDGYALRHGDTLHASPSRPKILEVIEEIAAGTLPGKSVHSGEASRIMTGAPVPEGADGVIPIEDTEMDGGRVRILRPTVSGENIRQRGEDLRSGEVVLEAEGVIGPAEVGLMASVGRSHIRVYQQPRVAILTTGNELADLGEALSSNQIMNSNGYALAAQVIEAGGLPMLLGVAKDTRQDLLDRFKEGLSADLVVISGGVSVGAYDFVKEVLVDLGVVMAFWRVAIKPGEPVAFGTLHGKPIFGLPGNPVSTMVTFEQFIRPALRKMQGHRMLYRPVIEAVLMERIAKKPGKMHFVRGVVKRTGNQYEAWTTGSQSSGVLTSMVKADGLLILPSLSAELEKGQSVKVQLLGRNNLSQALPGY